MFFASNELRFMPTLNMNQTNASHFRLKKALAVKDTAITIPEGALLKQRIIKVKRR
jgi:hypothetical protein